MKQMQFNDGYRALVRFSELELPIKESMRIAMLIKKLRPVIEVETEMEKKILEKHKASITANGIVTVGNDAMTDEERLELKIGFQKEWAELLNNEVDAEFTPVCIALDKLEDQKISASMIDKLDGFVMFE